MRIIISNGLNIFINLFNIIIVIKNILGKTNKLNSINKKIKLHQVINKYLL